MLLEYHILFMSISMILFFITIFLLFVDTDFNKAIAGMILCFFNVIVSWITGMNFFSIDLYAIGASGTLYNNYIYDYKELGLIFIALAYISVVFVFYAVYLLYDKPWDEASKISGNPYVYNSGKIKNPYTYNKKY